MNTENIETFKQETRPSDWHITDETNIVKDFGSIQATLDTREKKKRGSAEDGTDDIFQITDIIRTPPYNYESGISISARGREPKCIIRFGNSFLVLNEAQIMKAFECISPWKFRFFKKVITSIPDVNLSLDGVTFNLPSFDFTKTNAALPEPVAESVTDITSTENNGNKPFCATSNHRVVVCGKCGLLYDIHYVEDKKFITKCGETKISKFRCGFCGYVDIIYKDLDHFSKN